MNWKDIPIDPVDGYKLDLDKAGKSRLARWDGPTALANLNNYPVDIVDVEVMLLNGSSGNVVR